MILSGYKIISFLNETEKKVYFIPIFLLKNNEIFNPNFYHHTTIYPLNIKNILQINNYEVKKNTDVKFDFLSNEFYACFLKKQLHKLPKFYSERIPITIFNNNLLTNYYVKTKIGFKTYKSALNFVKKVIKHFKSYHLCNNILISG